MKYEIFTNYCTGDSFGSEDINHESLEVIVDGVDIARIAISYLEAHYKAVQEWENAPYASRGASGESKEQMQERISKEPWFPYPEKPDCSCWEFSICLPVNDQGETVNISLPYIGYFETLYSVYAEVYEDNDGLSFNARGW